MIGVMEQSNAAADAAIAATEIVVPEAVVPEAALEAARAAAAATFAANAAKAAQVESEKSRDGDIFDMPIEGDVPVGKRKSSPGSSPRIKNKKTSHVVPMSSEFSGTPKMIDKSSMYDVGTSKKSQMWYNIGFGIASCLACDNEPLKSINSDLFTDDFIDKMKSSMCFDYKTCSVDGGMDVVILRQGFNSLFADCSGEEPVNLELRSKELTEFVFGKSVDGVSKPNVRNFSTKLVPNVQTKGSLYEKVGTYHYFCFRLKSLA